MFSYSKLLLALVVVCIGCNSLAFNYPVNDPRLIKISEHISDSDYRYLATLGVGGATSLAGIALLVKSFWKTRAVDEFMHIDFLDRLEDDIKQCGKFCSGVIVTCLGVFIMANSKALPAYCDAAAQDCINRAVCK